MNKQGKFGVYIFLIFILLSFVIFGIIIYRTIETANNDCLKEKAKDYCEKNGQIYDMIYWRNTEGFRCFLSERERDVRDYRFTEQELEECK